MENSSQRKKRRNFWESRDATAWKVWRRLEKTLSEKTAKRYLGEGKDGNSVSEKCSGNRSDIHSVALITQRELLTWGTKLSVGGWQEGQITADGKATGSVRASIMYLFFRSWIENARRQFIDARGYMVKGKVFSNRDYVLLHWRSKEARRYKESRD